MALGDSITDDNTGNGASIDFMQRRKRGESLMAQWDADGVRPSLRAEFQALPAENTVPERQERASRLSNLRFYGTDKGRRVRDTY